MISSQYHAKRGRALGSTHISGKGLQLKYISLCNAIEYENI
jgi:hypothetical protein